ncbi:MAG: phosphoribosylamine--glycine ligase [Candidatus Altiarchaeales archaeon]|nr:phosphoribosylamine--glycine ligase [Candidatus Altiarchaeales archaeon]
MKVLVVGNGAREHALACALRHSPQKPDVYAFMTSVNPGIARIAKDYSLGGICQGPEVLKYAKNTGIDLVVIGPEAPLSCGVVDYLSDEGILCVGPRQAAAQIETNKTFQRSLMADHNIPGLPRYRVFQQAGEAEQYIRDCGFDVVVKPAGLTGGKGVKIMGEHFDREGAAKYASTVLNTGLGKINEVLVEERLEGEEFTLQAFVDGENLVGMPMVQDHKRAYEGDMGPNTGGMGSYNGCGFILPFLSEKDYEEAVDIMQKTVSAIKSETGEKYVGFLYGQFMATKEGLKVIEFNARLGDPEAMNVLTLLDYDFLDVCERMAGGMLTNKFGFKKQASVCKYLVPQGYPEDPATGVEVKVNEKKIQDLGGNVFYASVSEEGGRILTSSSRAIAVVGSANCITEAEVVVEESMKHVEGELFHRKDIGTRALIEKRIDHMKKLRG